MRSEWERNCWISIAVPPFPVVPGGPSFTRGSHESFAGKALTIQTNFDRGTTELAEKHTVDRDSTQTDVEIIGEGKSVTSAGKVEEKWSENVSIPVYQHLYGTPYTWPQRLRLFRRRWLSYKTMFTMMYRPLLLLRFPVVVWSGFIYGAALVWFNVLNATSSMIFTGTYNFSASMVGLTYFGPTIGAILAWVWSGWVSDKFSIFFARRNKGVREPEERLWLLTMNTIVLPAGLILWGVGAAHHVHWFGLVVGFMLIAFTSATGGAFAISYALDSYKDLGGEVMVTVMIIRVSSTEDSHDFTTNYRTLFRLLSDTASPHGSPWGTKTHSSPRPWSAWPFMLHSS